MKKRFLAVILAGALLAGCANVEISEGSVGGDIAVGESGADTAEYASEEDFDNAPSEETAGAESAGYIPADTADEENVPEAVTEAPDASAPEESSAVAESVPVPAGSEPVRTDAGGTDKITEKNGGNGADKDEKTEGSGRTDKTDKTDETDKTGGAAKPAGKKVGNGKLSEKGSGREGSAGTGSYNYGEALQKALIFYELQRSGDIDEETARCNWRGDSGMSDGADAGLDLTGGLYDAGDNAKFNLPMAYTAAMLAWSVYEDRDAYEKSGQLEYALDSIKWINDYLIKCHPSKDVYYYQVGDGNADHSWWGAAEVMHMDRPSFKVDRNSPGSTVAAEAAAALASCAAVYKDIDKKYAEECLTHAKQLYEFAESTKSDSGYTAANGFYTSWSGFYDELSWAGMWLYIAAGDKSYLEKAKAYEAKTDGNYKWTMCWDDMICLSMGAPP